MIPDDSPGSRDASSLPEGVPAASPDHVCQVYETDDFLSDSVAGFLADGLTLEHPVLLFSTPGRWEGVADVLHARGIDALRAQAQGGVRIQDASAALARIMNGDMPDRHRFSDVVGTEIEQAVGRRGGGRIRIFGEMVDILWRDGNEEGAIRLEDLWNDLLTTRDFSLLCAYSMGNVYRESAAGQFREIRLRHGHVHEEPSSPE